jgi:hypothetical protein
MRTTLAFFFLLATSAVAQEQTIHVKRVASVTWDSQSGKLVWVVQDGQEQNGEFVASSEERYEVSPKEAVIAVEGQQRKFTDTEVTRLWSLLHSLTLFCVESTMWWETGQGVPLNHGKPPEQPPSDQSEPKPTARPDMAPTKVMDEPQYHRVPGLIPLVALDVMR